MTSSFDIDRTEARQAAAEAFRREALNSGRPVSVDDALKMAPFSPISSSRDRGWGGVTVDVFPPHSNLSALYPALNQHMIAYGRSGSARLVQRRDNQIHCGVITPGDFLLAPAGMEKHWEGDAPSSVRLYVPTELLTSASDQLWQRSTVRFEVRNVFQSRDPLITRIVESFVAEIGRAPHPTQLLIANALSCAVAAHLLRGYNLFDPLAPPQTAPLGRFELSKIAEYVEDNIERPIGLDELAELISVSRFHFSRLFKRSMGVTVIQFVEQCRIRRAQQLITESGLPLAEVAAATGFADQSHFTRRFHRHAGVTPGIFARDHGRRRSSRPTAVAASTEQRAQEDSRGNLGGRAKIPARSA